MGRTMVVSGERNWKAGERDETLFNSVLSSENDTTQICYVFK